ncbi:pV [Equine adenovirus 2]|uniref:PV n=1 Tax=Equine adenovirus B serotype 2 TaxID=67603 RepID=A0A0K1DCR6_ADEE2|nr:pV [Equine adenovirus 2]AKT26029.1 pV [Equine adenovirus 2]
MTSITREIKEELLRAAHPEIYGLPNIKSNAKRKADSALAGRVTKRRPAVDNFLKPGSASPLLPKRPYDEVYTDKDILQQASEAQNEFAYGKRRKRIGGAFVLDTENPTPSMKPVTRQTVFPISGVKRGRSDSGDFDLAPTVQVLLPSKTLKTSENEEEVSNVPSSASNVELDDIKMRSYKQVTPDLGVQTVDVEMAVASKPSAPASTADSSRVVSVRPYVRYHPSIRLGPPVRRTRRRRRRRRRVARKSLPLLRRNSKGEILPNVVYHPSITVTPPSPPLRRDSKGRFLPNVAYHPSITT